jgi:hypothetical protein
MDRDEFDSVFIYADQAKAREHLAEIGEDWLDLLEWDHMSQEDKDKAEFTGDVELDTDYVHVVDTGSARVLEQEIIE